MIKTDGVKCCNIVFSRSTTYWGGAVMKGAQASARLEVTRTKLHGYTNRSYLTNEKAFEVMSRTTVSYLSNCKDLQDRMDMYDYGARFYDPLTGSCLFSLMVLHLRNGFPQSSPLQFLTNMGM